MRLRKGWKRKPGGSRIATFYIRELPDGRVLWVIKHYGLYKGGIEVPKLGIDFAHHNPWESETLNDALYIVERVAGVVDETP